MSEVEVRGLRIVGLDAVRGVAVVSMIADHAALVAIERGFGPRSVEQLLRLTVGRIALPVFMLVSGLLLKRPPSVRRSVQAAGAGAVVSTVSVAAGLGLGVPDILAVWVLAAWAVGLAARRSALAVAGVACVGIVQAASWPVPWTGYQPGTVAALLAIGWFARYPPVLVELDGVGDRLPVGLARIGARPMAAYMASTVALGLMAGAWRFAR